MTWSEQEANSAVGQALNEWVAALPDEEPDTDIGVLGDWLAVISMVRVNEHGQPVTQYYVTMRGGTMLPQVALGLLHQGIQETNASVVDSD